MSESILLDIQGQVATITLNRPDRLNSFNPEMHQALQESLDESGSARPAPEFVGN